MTPPEPVDLATRSVPTPYLDEEPSRAACQELTSLQHVSSDVRRSAQTRSRIASLAPNRPGLYIELHDFLGVIGEFGLHVAVMHGFGQRADHGVGRPLKSPSRWYWCSNEAAKDPMSTDRSESAATKRRAGWPSQPHSAATVWRRGSPGPGRSRAHVGGRADQAFRHLRRWIAGPGLPPGPLPRRRCVRPRRRIRGQLRTIGRS